MNRQTHTPARPASAATRTEASAAGRVVCILTPTNFRRLLPGFRPWVHAGREYWQLSTRHNPRRILDVVRRWDPAGIVTQELPPALLRALVALGKPLVVAPFDADIPSAGRVDVDDEQVGRLVAQHLMSKGLSHFAFWGERFHYSWQRERGYAAALAERGFAPARLADVARRPREFDEYWAFPDRRLVEWLRALPKPVGVFASHDPLGRILVGVAAHLGLNVPDEVAVVGVNNDDLICEMAHPPLASVAIPWEKIGYEAARIMEEIIAGARPPAAPVLLPPLEIVERLSSDVLAIPDRRVAAALRHIRDHACSPMAIRDVLKTVPLPRRTLERRVREYLGRSPAEELARLRLAQAKALLARTDLPMPDVAERCGLSNGERLAVLFRRLTGQTPTSYRRQFRLGRQA
jgi:LacI family transcriptional regulator